jgi:hypothetical protein
LGRFRPLDAVDIAVVLSVLAPGLGHIILTARSADPALVVASCASVPGGGDA